MKKIALIGATGSIGRQVVNVALRHPDKFKIVAVCSEHPSAVFDETVKATGAVFSAVASKDREAAYSVAEYGDADVILNAAGGYAGLKYSLRAINAGKNLALANKETLVCGGSLVTRLAEKSGSTLIPVDSEHSAIWQCLGFGSRKNDVRRLIITASGGAFRGRKQSELERVTPEQALAHPTWKMGRKITIDSATLANKGYEIIEAHELFGVPYDRIEAVIQRQSVIHSLVEFNDGACLAQMGTPTMEVPIQLALSYPERFETSAAPLDFTKAFSIDFEPLVREDYPLFDLAVKCGEEGGTYPCAFNAADEEAVRAFIDGKIPFTAIYTVVNGVLQTSIGEEADDIGTLEKTDFKSREAAQKIIKRLQ